MSTMALSQLGLWLVSAVNLVLILVMYRQFGLVAMSSAAGHDNDGVAVGKPAQPLVLRESGSDAISDISLDGRWSIILFATTHCQPCIEAAERLNREMPDLQQRGLRVVAALQANDADVRAFGLARSPDVPVYVDPDGATSAAWGIRVTPFIMLVGPDGIVQAKGLVGGGARLERFLARVYELINSEASSKEVVGS
jgi:peroxiredoxin